MMQKYCFMPVRLLCLAFFIDSTNEPTWRNIVQDSFKNGNNRQVTWKQNIQKLEMARDFYCVTMTKVD